MNQYFFKIILFVMGTILFSSCNTTGNLYKQAEARFFQEAEHHGLTVTEESLAVLPDCVSKYISYCGWSGKPVPETFEIRFHGEFSMDPDKSFKQIKSVQLNSLAPRNRIFKIKNPLFAGVHRYWDGEAGMIIKLLGLFTVVDAKGEEFNQSELLTWFNDACIIAPGMLPYIQGLSWNNVSEFEATATLEYHDISVSATLYFNESYELINFITDDRFYADGKSASKKVRWSTPMHEYVNDNGIKRPSYGEAIWDLPEGPYTYAKLYIEEIAFNHISF